MFFAKRGLELFIMVTMMLTIKTYAGFTAVSGGKALAQIIIPQEPSKAELFAAEELQNYVEKISGATLPIMKTSKTGKTAAFVIGSNSTNSEIQKKLDSLYPSKYDRFAVVCEGNYIHFVAPHSSGLLYSVWSWLEDQQGVAWLMPGEKGMYIPKKKDIKVSDFQKYEMHAFDYRDMSVYGTESSRKKVGGPKSLLEQTEHNYDVLNIWAMRMRLNKNNLEEKDRYYNLGSGHSYAHYLPASRYAKDHPEWFNMIGDRRMTAEDKLWQVCFTNKEAAKQFAENMKVTIKEFLAKGARLEHLRINVSPNDWKAICECSNCAKIKDSDGTSSSQVLHFANMVAAEIQKTYPNAKIYYYVYNNHGRIPEHVKPQKGVIPWITSWASNDGLAVNHAHSLFSDQNERYRSIYKWFNKNSDEISTYTYYAHYYWFTPFPVLTQLEQDIREMNKFSANGGMYIEAHHHWGTQGITLYLLPKLLWNPELDVEKEVIKYCEKAYGPAARFVKEYFYTLQEKMDSLRYVCGTKLEIPELLTPKIISACDKLLDSVEAKLKEMDANTRWRAELLISAWRNSAKFAKAISLVRTGRSPNCQKVVKNLLEEVATYADTDMGRWAFEHQMAVKQLGTTGVDFNFMAVPAGKHHWADNLMYGGTLNFYVKCSNKISRPLWGYYLKAKSSGVIDIPLQADSGLKFKSVHCSFKGSKETGMHLYASASGVPEILVSKSPTEGCSLPEKLMGKNKINLILKFDNKSNKDKYVLTSGKITLEVVQ